MVWRDDSSFERGGSRRRVLLFAVLALLGIGGVAPAQTTGSLSAATTDGHSALDAPVPRDEAKRRLQDVEGDLSRSADQRRQLEAEIEGFRTDRLRFNAALIDTTERVRAAESRVAETGARLDTLTGSEEAVRRSLESRRGLIAEVLASLQRLGRKPPPAILVKPDDILKTIRSSMMLGAVVPELREEAEALAADLTQLASLRASIGADRDTLSSQIADLGRERSRLEGLIDARQHAQVDAEATLGQERVRSAELARQATSLRDLVGKMEANVDAARRAAAAADAATSAQQKAAEADAESVRAKVAAGPFRDPARLQPAVAFAETRGLLPLPVAGRLVKSYGQPDGFGGTEKGLSIAAGPNAVVTAPADGWVAFSGPYRTYGQVLILNMSGGYYTVMAGMDRVDVALGQFVLSGEPVGVMGDGSVKAAAAIALGAADPVLYVEFRKDGSAIDPGPWWAKAALEKVRG